MDAPCSNNPGDEADHLRQNHPTVAAALATLGLVSALAPPEWIVVATSILASKIVESGLDAMCEVWHESLDLKAKGQPGRASEDSK
jgi:hypothetical protein